MKKDSQIFSLIQQEYDRQLHGIELIASENFVSEQVLRSMGSCLTNKYAEGLPEKRYYGGCQVVDQVEQLAIWHIQLTDNLGSLPGDFSTATRPDVVVGVRTKRRIAGSSADLGVWNEVVRRQRGVRLRDRCSVGSPCGREC